MEKEEWGPWIEHDGQGCPCLGQVVHVIALNKYGFTYEAVNVVAGGRGGRSWDWSNFPDFRKIIRYRIRKPRGMVILESLLQDLPQKVDA